MFNGTELVVECTAYTRWESVWGQASEYLQQAWALLKSHQPDVHVLEYRLAVTDAFTAPEDAYRVGELFNQDATILPRMLADAGPIWHLNLGWVEVVSNGRIFETMQTQSTGRREGYEAKGPYRITLQHVLRAAVDQTPHEDLSQMNALITDLHLRNKRLVKDALRPEILERIGLT